MSAYHEDSAGLPSGGGLLHHGPASVHPGSQLEGFTGDTLVLLVIFLYFFSIK